MKIQMRLMAMVLSIAIVFSISPQMAWADEDSIEMFETETVEGGIQINGFTAEYVASRVDDTTADVVIPAQIDDVDVVAFAAYAFYDDPYDTEDGDTLAPELLKEVNISEKCTSIGYGAFRNCTNLTTLNLPATSDGLYFGTYSFAGSGVTEFTFYEYMSFAGVTDGSVLTTDSGFIFQYSDVATINFPDTWSDEAGLMISAYMFNGCPITELTLPSYLSEVGKMAFMSCSITDLNWPETCSIDDGMKFAGSVFMGCNFDVMTLPQYVSQMGDNAFFCVDTVYLPEDPIEQFNIYAFCASPVVVAPSKESYTTWNNYEFDSYYGIDRGTFSYEFTIQFLYDDEYVAREDIKLYGEQIDYVKDEDGVWARSSSYTFPANTGDNVGWASEKNSVAIPYVHIYECVFDTFYEAGTIENQYLYLGQYLQTYAGKEDNIVSNVDSATEGYNKLIPDDYDEDSRYVIVMSTSLWGGTYEFDDIKWQILDETDNQDGTYTYSLVSDVALHGRDFDASEAGWADSDIRAWLNGENTVSEPLEGYDNILIADPDAYNATASVFDDDFYGTAFEDWEKDLINTTVVDGLYYVSTGANDEDYYDTTTEDKIYLMSYFDACDYFTTTEMRIVKYSGYASREISSSMKSGVYTKWFTRTTYAYSAKEYVLIFLATGGTSYTSYVANNYAIRPAMTITVSEDYVTTTGTGTSDDPYSFAPIPTYTVSYDGNGSSGTTEDSNEYEDGVNITILDNGFAEPDGQYFTSWNTKSDGSGTTYYAGDIIVCHGSDINLYAQWTDYFAMTYDANDGTGDVTDEGEYKPLDVATVLANDFTREGFYFDSWNTKADGTGSTYFSKGKYTFVDKDMTLYAIWTEDEPETATTGNDLDADGTHTEYLGDVDDMMYYPHPDEFVVVDMETGDVLTEYVDYEVTLHTHLPGHTTALVHGINDYAGDDDEVDYIIRQDISDYNGDGRGGIDNSIFWGNIASEYVYTGSPIEPVDFLTSIIGELTEGVDYTLEYEDITASLTYNSPMRNSTSLLYNASSSSETTAVGTKQVTITGIGDVFYGEIVLTYEVVEEITNHAHSMDYQYSFEYDGDPLADEMIASIVVTETTTDGEETVLDPSQYTVTFDSSEDDYTTHPGYVNFTVHVEGCSHYLYGTMIIMKDISNDDIYDYVGGVDDTVYIMDDSIETDFTGEYSDLVDLYLMDAETDGYMRFLNKSVEGASYYNFTVYRDGDYVVFDADEITTDCFYGKIIIYMPEESSGGGSYKPIVTTSSTSTATLNKDDHFAYMQGYPDGSFLASQNITRAETVVMFARLLTETMDEDTAYDCSFNDIIGNEWYANQVGYMEQFGITTGYTDGSFGGNNYITRAEFAVIASRFDELADADENIFSDVSDTHWAASYINSASTKGWINGYEGGIFCPEQYITRAEVATLVNRVLERSADEEFISENQSLLISFTDLSSNFWAYLDICEATNSHDYTKNDDGTETWTEVYDS